VDIAPPSLRRQQRLIFWVDDQFEVSIRKKGKLVEKRLHDMVQSMDTPAEIRGRGLIWGVAFEDPHLASKVSHECFERGMVVETAGIDDQVLKLLPSLTIDESDLIMGLDIIAQSLAAVTETSEVTSD